MRKLMLGFFTAAAITGTTPLWAQDVLFDKLDANQDGFITKDEVPEERQPLLDRLLQSSDKNADGKLSVEEFAAALKNRDKPPADRPPAGKEGNPDAREGEGRPERRFDPKQIFERLDADKDGKISPDEAPERMKENFDRLDANSDGAIDLEEFSRIAGRRPEGRRGDRPDGDRPEGDRPGDRPEGAPPRRPAGPPEGRPGEGRPGEGRPGMGMIPVIRALDADGDGEISADELKNASAALAKLDKNADGKLTREELLPEFRGFGGRPGAGPPPDGRPNPEELLSRLRAADADGDGKISKEEAPPVLKDHFDRIDTNSDGAIDKAEIRQMLERFRDGPRGEGREGREGRPEGRRPDGDRPDRPRPDGRRPAGEPPADAK